MGKTTETQWIPSGGMLAVAIVAALVAAILVNVYVGYARSAYENGSVWYLQIKREVPKNDPIQESNLASVQIPRVLVPKFSQAVTDDPSGRAAVIGRKIPRRLAPGEFLWYPDFDPGLGLADVVIPVPKGYEMVTIPVNTALPGQQLQPNGWVNFRGDFDFSSDRSKPDVRTLVVIENVQVKALGGSTEPVAQRARTYGDVQVVVRSSQATELIQIVKATKDGKFTIGVVSKPGTDAADPEITKEVRAFMKDRQKPPATGTAPAKGGGTSTLLPEDL